MPYFCRNPLILTDFYAIQNPIVWHIFGAYFLPIWGVGVVRIILTALRLQVDFNCDFGIWASKASQLGRIISSYRYRLEGILSKLFGPLGPYNFPG